MKEDLFKPGIQWRSPQRKGEQFHLRLDCYSAHGTMDVKALIVPLGITFHHIPARDRSISAS
jgi:hypothetical protein